MSLSPTTKSANSAVLAYDKGWAAVNRLIRAGRSFSGREENCCFLNLGQPRFATVSAAVELNLPDDGRGLATTDWDGDGRVDFWVTNRTGPRVRFLKNEYASDSDYVALQLVGTRSNRDAIGARVTVHLAGDSPPLTRTLHGGSGFISQSSKTLTLGLGHDATIARVEVRWPGGDIETFRGLETNRRYLLQQGSGEAKPVAVPRLGPWQAAPAREPQLPVTSRVVLLEPAPLPRSLQATGWDGQPVPLATTAPGTRGRVINLWATWCANCMQELSEWTAQEKTLREAGLDVLTLCVDQPSEDRAADLEKLRDLTARLGLPFQGAASGAEVVELLNVFQRSFVGRQADLPLPSTFLLDDRGRVAVIYQGPVEAQTLANDARLLNASRDAIFAGALPFRGLWLETPPTTPARTVAVAMVEQGYLKAAEAYARQLLQDDSDSGALADSGVVADTGAATIGSGQLVTQDAKKETKSDAASLHHLLGALLFDEKRYEEARDHYERALERLPQQRGLREELARTLVQLQQYEPAIGHLRVLLEEQPDNAELLAELGRLHLRLNQPRPALAAFDQSLRILPKPEVRFEYANLLRDTGQYERARNEYERVLQDVPSPVVLNNLAWLLATAESAETRDGHKAVELAERASQMTDRQQPRVLGTLAAAYAEKGDFNAAVRTLDEALALARQQEPALVTELSARKEDFRQRKPTREPVRLPLDQSATSPDKPRAGT